MKSYELYRVVSGDELNSETTFGPRQLGRANKTEKKLWATKSEADEADKLLSFSCRQNGVFPKRSTCGSDKLMRAWSECRSVGNEMDR